MRSFKASTWLCAVALGAGAGLLGCQESSPARTPGEKTELQGKMIKEAGATRQKGEEMMVEGQGKKARGEQLIAQGKTDEGKLLASEGDAEVKEGQEMIRQAEQAKINAMKMPVSTQPTMPPTMPTGTP